ncbi:MAG TPA: glucans biosynthesis glucosyltransferase MdoH [Thermohalobaculum sp.]|nr:glucans biosynthesis glucosyltransferase MdoH [Thermohalobaculum sp.]
MSDTTDSAVLAPRAIRGGAEAERGPLTPAGLQRRRTLAARRLAVAALNLGSMAGLLWGILHVFGAGGWTATDVVLVACFAVGAPWTVMGLWNAVLGLWLMHGARDGLMLAAPQLAAARGDRPVQSRTALAMTIRNEDTARVLARLIEMRRSLDATGFGHLFDIHVLSDSSDPAIAAEEERLFAQLRGRLGGLRAHYRRRARNEGFKAGNIRDFLSGAGRDHAFFVPLDSDSLMSGEAIVAMVRIMEAHPRIGILQSLVTGLPAASAFARVFQFGMRHGMRSFTMGAAWWQGDCGPYWGHNAVVRTAPFRRHCRLPRLSGRGPLGGAIMSHDQVEAVLMRRAGYEVRVLPVESESWEENPPTLADFVKRDLRWCQGNMQYWPLLGLRGLRPVSRFQLAAAIGMYLAAPAWMLMTAAAGAKMIEGDLGQIDIAFGIAMFFIMFAVSLVPKLAGLADILLTPGGTARYGGTGRFLAGGLLELLFGMLLAPVVAFRVTLFLVGLIFGRATAWGSQRREARRLGWREAAAGLWPQTLAGLGLGTAIALVAGGSTLAWAAPVLAGLSLAIPFAVLTAAPAAGRALARQRLCATPDELAPPELLRRLAAGAGEAEASDPPKAAA